LFSSLPSIRDSSSKFPVNRTGKDVGFVAAIFVVAREVAARLVAGLVAGLDLAAPKMRTINSTDRITDSTRIMPTLYRLTARDSRTPF
jgi:hypothetical protein